MKHIVYHVNPAKRLKLRTSTSTLGGDMQSHERLLVYRIFLIVIRLILFAVYTDVLLYKRTLYLLTYRGSHSGGREQVCAGATAA